MLTTKRVRDAKPNGKTRIVWDHQVPRFGLQISRGGTKNYIVRYRVDGRWRQRIGCRADHVTLGEARRMAMQVLLRVRTGEVDPLGRDSSGPQPTVAEGVARFFAEYAPRRIEIGTALRTHRA